jgi:hypothetical protein
MNSAEPPTEDGQDGLLCIYERNNPGGWLACEHPVAVEP